VLFDPIAIPFAREDRSDQKAPETSLEIVNICVRFRLQDRPWVRRNKESYSSQRSPRHSLGHSIPRL